MAVTSSLLILISILSCVIALPSQSSSVPAIVFGFDDSNDAHHLDARDVPHVLRQATVLGFDGENDLIHFYARDALYLGAAAPDIALPHLQRRQDVGNCGPLTSNQVDSISGWNKLEDVRKGLFGDGSHQTHTNPQQEPDPTHNPPVPWNLPDLKAQRCIASDPIGTLQLVGEPMCDKQTTTIEGGSDGTDTTASLVQRFPFLILFPTKKTFEATIGIPTIGSTKISTSISFSYSHTDQKATSDDKSQTTSQKLTIPNPDGKHCTASLDTETCRAKAKGEITTYASGWVWWSFTNKVSHNEQWAKEHNVQFTDFGKHWSWAVTLEGYLSPDERVIKTPMTSDIGTSQVNALYNAVCK
ncbi:hypothetical protein DL96DRAFT_1767123 [Flagelloscypha sp. PMI_526]|nr:hypothetical protein DL96DRAFT_1767123 [Flagelloscypha sp. PMI_526]